MQVYDAEERVVGVLVGHPLAQRAQIAPEVHVAGGLDAGEHAIHSWMVFRRSAASCR